VQFSDQTEPIQRLFGRAKLVVIEYPATSYLETMAADLPTVCFWEPRYWRIRKDAAAYFEEFRRAGILWDSPEAAAAHVEAIHEDPWRWWNGRELQQIRRQFVRRHAWGEPHWLRRWVEVIQAEAAASERGVVSPPGDTAAVPSLEEEPVGSV
jgi:putative transferase (TIGR04331 family)